ncbi:recombination protein RecO [Helicobacter valdiviensis]|uniref:Recombination protein RecO n=1 Tax=Helicobacter valdiviensis TaxID=1458358 RepID=A0A2W6MVB9_9HELI|nr:recombination protein RecO [Helicobacter valdiviensis]PZT48474.1 recombination protein RecO [Helicobacter valdiviensis]
MQGYILHTQKVREEDLLVKVLSPKQLYTLYRFYGARHSIIHLGNKIDFYIEKDLREIGKLRDPIHLGFAWEKEMQKRYFWQQFLKLLHTHLKDISTLEDFYFNLLEEGSMRLLKENPKRTILNLYIKLLNFEGRNNSLQSCLICEGILNEEVCITRGFVCAHPHCLKGEILTFSHLENLFNLQIELLEDDEVDKLWNVLMLGL